MFTEWFTTASNCYKKTNFEGIQNALKNPNDFIILNTLSVTEQYCLITGTIDALTEEKVINEMMENIEIPDKSIIIYGKNANDESTYIKYKQLRNLGITKINIYSGGIFEWLLLQDIYGNNYFPTTSKMLDILKYK